jgi:F0F1-type ATP synthase assembly protein I
VLNSLDTGRRLAFRIVLIQVLVAASATLLFLPQGLSSALAAGMGGGAVVLGSLALGLRSFGRAPISANAALLRMLVGMALKWVVFLVVLYLALVRFTLPPIPLLMAAVVTTLSFLFAARLKA